MSPTPIAVLITGGASGIGAALATSFARNPPPNTAPYITIADLNASAGTALATDLTTSTSHVQFVRTDISDFASLKAAFKAAIRFNPAHTLDHVIANAGRHDEVESRLIKAITTAPAPNFATLDDDTIQPPDAPTASLNTLLTGNYFTVWLAAYYFRLPGPTPPSTPNHKSVTITVSTAGYVDMASTRNPYWMSKWGLRGLFHSAKQDMHLVGARLNLVCPYWVKTNLTADLVANTATAAAIPGGWTEMEDVVTAFRRCVEDAGTSQRSLGVFPQPWGVVDLGDDMQGFWGGKEVIRLMGEMIGGKDGLEATRKAQARE